MGSRQERRSHGDYTIGWICAIEPELTASLTALDEEHEKLPSVAGDGNSYVFGRIGPHNVVIATLPSGTYGTNAAAVAATQMRRSFKELRFALMVGVGGGVPKITGDPETSVDIRLGDIVVSHPNETSNGVIQYDLGRTLEGHAWPKRTGALDRPPLALLNAIATLKSRCVLYPQLIRHQLDSMLQKIPPVASQYAYQGSENDFLYESTAVRDQDAIELSGSKRRLEQVQRPPRSLSDPVIHYGTIASGNQVVKDSVARDYWRDTESVLCFEMEAAGLILAFQCLIIRGICDYADSHKNKRWQPYAALAAAAYAKQLLLEVPAEKIHELEPMFDFSAKERSGSGENIHYALPSSSSSFFSGREDLISRIATAFSGQHVNSSNYLQRRFVISGLGGVGKSELATRFAEVYRDNFWGIFWIDVGDHADLITSTNERDMVPTAAALEGFRKISELCGIQNQSMEGVKTWLANTKNHWLLIIDNADNPRVDYAQYFPPGSSGSILLTSRNRDTACHETVGSINLENLKPDLGSDLILLSSGIPKTLWPENSKTAAEIVSVLGCHTLALVQAGAFIRSKMCRIQDYTRLIEREKERLLKFESSQMKSTYGSVYATFEVSAHYLASWADETAKDASDLLHLLAFMHYSGISEAMFQWASKNSVSLRNQPSTHNIGYLPTNNIRSFPTSLYQYLPTWMCFWDFEGFDRFRWRQACSLLASLAVVTIENTDEDFILSVHPLVHDWLLCRQTLNQRARWWRSVASVLALATFDKNKEARLHPHIRSCLLQPFEEYLENASLVHMEQVLMHFFEPLHFLNDPETLGHVFEYLFHKRKESSHSAQNDAYAIENFYCRHLTLTGRAETAVAILEKLINAPDVRDGFARGSLQRTLAHTYRRLGRATEAAELMIKISKTARIFSVASSTINAAAASTQIELAIGYQDIGRNELAEDILETLVAVLGHKSSDDLILARYKRGLRIRIWRNLGRFHASAGRHRKATLLFEKAAEHCVAHRSPYHPLTLRTYHSLATSSLKAGEYQRAVEVLEFLLAADDATLSLLHRDGRKGVEADLRRAKHPRTTQHPLNDKASHQSIEEENWCFLHRGIGRRKSSTEMSGKVQLRRDNRRRKSL